MTMSIPKIPMDDGRIDTITDFLMDTSSRMMALQKILTDAEKNLPGFSICGTKVDPKKSDYMPEVHVLGDVWMQLASVWPNNWRIESHYTSGPETEKPWNEHLFCLTLTHEGCEYFCLMNGAEIDRRGIVVPDKEALMRGDG